MIKSKETKSQRSIQSIEVGFRLIRALEAAPGPMSLKSLSAAAEMSASKAHLYLVSFCGVGLAAQEADTGYYTLGPYALQLGLASISKADLVHHARRALLELRDLTGEAAYLSVKGNFGPCIVAKVDGLKEVPMVVRVGFSLPLTGSATGHVFMTFGNEEWLERSLKTERHLGGAARRAVPSSELAQAIKLVKLRGYAKTENLLNPGHAAISAPIFDHEGNLAGALTLLGPASDFDRATEEKLSKLLLQRTIHLSEMIGHRPNGSS
jgi:DNA-binding IclR family transcriptional regulator